jgi:hypothetical protein
MKTPMQELIEQLKELYDFEFKVSGTKNEPILWAIGKAQALLKKEKEVIENAVKQGWDYNEEGLVQWMGETYYNETFNTKEK